MIVVKVPLSQDGGVILGPLRGKGQDGGACFVRAKVRAGAVVLFPSVEFALDLRPDKFGYWYVIVLHETALS